MSPCPGKRQARGGNEGKEKKNPKHGSFWQSLVSNLLPLSRPETRSPFILHLSLQQLQNNPGGVGWGF